MLLWRRRQSTAIATGDVSKGSNFLLYTLIYSWFIFSYTLHHSDYRLLLLVQAGSDEVAVRSLRAIKNDFRGLGRLVDGAGIQVAFACIPTVAGKDSEMTRKIHLINRCLRG